MKCALQKALLLDYVLCRDSLNHVFVTSYHRLESSTHNFVCNFLFEVELMVVQLDHQERSVTVFSRRGRGGTGVKWNVEVFSIVILLMEDAFLYSIYNFNRFAGIHSTE